MASREEIRRVSIFINGKEGDLTLKQLSASSRKLRNELAKIPIGSEAARKKMLELKQVNKVLQDVREEVRQVGGAFSWLKTELGKGAGLLAGFFGVQAITTQAREIITQNASLSDSLADVQKTTGLTETSVRRLNEEFKKFDTRSSQEQLLGLAEVAGKLGISAESDVLGFVRAADQINVALGKDLGNAEQAVNDLGKLVDIFKIKDAYGLEDALIRTGSAINSLGAAGTANEGYIVDFTKRVGGVAPAAGVSLENILGLAATLDQLGQSAEVSSTTYTNVIPAMFKDTATFARIAGMDVGEFTKLLNTDANEAFIRLLEGLRGNNEGMSQMVQKLDELGIEGARSTQVLAVLANNTDELRRQQEFANSEFALGTSLTEEFNTKNQTLGAGLDRLRKKWKQLITGDGITDFLKNIVTLLNGALDWVLRNGEGLLKLAKSLAVAGTAWVSYKTYVALANSQTAAFLGALIRGQAVMTVSRTGIIALAGAKALLTGNFKKAATAARLLWVTMAANPIGAVVAVVAAASAAVYLFANRLSEAEKAQKRLKDLNIEAEKSILSQRNELNRLVEVARDETIALDERREALKKINKISPEYLGNLDLDIIKTQKATEAIEKYNESLLRNARVKAAQNKLVEAQGKLLDLEAQAQDFGVTDLLLNAANPLATAGIGKEIQEQRKKIAQYENIIRNRGFTGNEIMIDANPTGGSALLEGASKTPSGGDGGGDGSQDPNKKLQKLRDQLDKEINDWILQAEKSDPGADKVLLEIEARYKELLQKAVGFEEEKDKITQAYLKRRNNRLAEIEKENAEESRKEYFLNLEEKYAEELTLLKQKFADNLITEEEYEQQRYEKEQERLTIKALMIESVLTLDELELDEKKRLAEEKMQLEEKIADNAIAQQKRIRDTTQRVTTERALAEQELQQVIVSAYAEGFSIISSLFEQNSAAYKLFFLLEKAAAVAKVIINLQQELAAIRLETALQAAQVSSIPVVGPALAAAVRAKGVANQVKARVAAGISIATISAQTIKEVAGYEEGGYSDIDYSRPQGFVNRPTLFRNSASGRPFIAGEGYKREYIISSEQLKDPVIADFVAMIESIRGVRRFEYGGYNKDDATSGTTPPSITVQNDNKEIVSLLRILIEETKKEKSQGFNYRMWEEQKAIYDRLMSD